MEHRYYSLEFKHEVCQAYLKGNASKREIRDKYGILGQCTVLKWLRKLGYLSAEGKPVIIPTTQVAKTNPESKEVKELKARVLAAELKAKAYQRLIALAEKKYKIEIEKK